jgi:uncharacterized protein YndB with AHSA1/START domain
MHKEKYHIEFVFEKVGKQILWDYISTFAGLSEWFADGVSVDGKIFTFQWSKASASAEVIALNQGNYIRFRWCDDEDAASFFELRLHKNDLTGDIVLEITDFAEKNETESAVILWESQIRTLRRTLGLI